MEGTGNVVTIVNARRMPRDVEKPPPSEGTGRIVRYYPVAKVESRIR